MHTTAIIVAGGRGERMKADRPKPMLEVGGRSLLERSVTAFDRHGGVDELIVVLSPALADSPPAFLSGLDKPTKIARGGHRRQDSVANGFDLVSSGTRMVLVHDAARPFVSQALIARTLAAAERGGAAIAALPVRDTVKQMASTGGERVVTATLARESIFLAQTPQAFRRHVLEAAIALGRQGVDATDEAALAERAGFQVHLVEGDPANIKITTPDDLEHASHLAGVTAAAGPVRTGAGYDLHRLVPGRPFVLGGITIPFERGPIGHSDADALCHAITDAILGAACAGDIGRHFPDDDNRWRDASSLDLLSRAAAIIKARGYAIENVDAIVILERPRLAGHIDEMRQCLASTLGVDVGRISIKGKTNEGVGEIGRGEAIAVHAVALVRQIG